MNLSVIRVHSAWSWLLGLQPLSSLWKKHPIVHLMPAAEGIKITTAHTYFYSSLWEILSVCCPRVLIFLFAGLGWKSKGFELLKGKLLLPFEFSHPEINSHISVEGLQLISRSNSRQVASSHVLASVEKCQSKDISWKKLDFPMWGGCGGCMSGKF